MATLTQRTLKKWMHYCPRTGVWTSRRDRANGRIKAGQVCGWVCPSTGYVRLNLLGKRYQAHQLAVLYMKGFLPPEVDHENLNKADNRWRNLSVQSRAANVHNRAKMSNSQRRYKGVHKVGNRYRARLGVGGKRLHSTLFSSELEAAVAYDNLARVHYGKRACTNQKLGLL
jgi:hypothetical protein